MTRIFIGPDRYLLIHDDHTCSLEQRGVAHRLQPAGAAYIIGTLLGFPSEHVVDVVRRVI